MKRVITASIGCMVVCTIVLSGCGQTSNKTANGLAGSNSSASGVVRHGNTLIEGASGLAGAAAQKKLVATANNKPSNALAQVQAAQSAFVNGDAATAIKYYKRAIALSPKSGDYLTALGNVYRELNKDPKSAVPYYTKSTNVDPTYAFGWYQLAVAESQLGQISAATATLNKGLKSVKSSDPNYSTLQAELKSLQTSSTSNSSS